MPIYEYECEACGLTQEHYLAIHDDATPPCEACGKSALVKRLTTCNFAFAASIGVDGWTHGSTPNTMQRVLPPSYGKPDPGSSRKPGESPLNRSPKRRRARSPASS